MPVIFIGHGSPMNAVLSNPFTKTLSEWGRNLTRPQAILCVSAHWYGQGVKVQASPMPSIVHDFYGFPEALYAVQYPAPGSPEFAAKTQKLLDSHGAETTMDWGIDHGAWSALVHLFPKADIPVFQLSLNYQKSLREHYELARALKPLRKEGVLILGSGNIVHNLRMLAMDPAAPPHDWAMEFDARVKKAIDVGDHESLIDYKTAFPKIAALAVPTPDHYLPLLYCLAASDSSDSIIYPYEGYEHAAISMRAAQWSST